MVLDPRRPVVVVADVGEENEAIVRLGRVGFDEVVGHLEHGMASLQGSEELLQGFTRFAPNTLRERLEGEGGRTLVDVRTHAELSEGTIVGSIHIPLNELQMRVEELPRDQPVAVFCAGGYRSSIAASLLQRAGFDDVSDIVGGYSAWAATGGG